MKEKKWSKFPLPPSKEKGVEHGEVVRVRGDRDRQWLALLKKYIWY
jgi:hypothetical protein